MEPNKKMDAKSTIRLLKRISKPENLEGMSRFGINTKNALGITVTDLRKVAKKIGRGHVLALGLWDSGIHEARILSSIVDVPEQVTESQMETWVKDFDSWDLCDQCCGNLFDRTSFAYKKALEWPERREEYVKRAGFALMAALAAHDKGAPDRKLLQFLPIIERESDDERNFVRKAVNWALRGIGKRNPKLNKAAITAAERIKRRNTKAARWIASDALRELESEAIRGRLNG